MLNRLLGATLILAAATVSADADAGPDDLKPGGKGTMTAWAEKEKKTVLHVQSCPCDKNGVCNYVKCGDPFSKAATEKVCKGKKGKQKFWVQVAGKTNVLPQTAKCK